MMEKNNQEKGNLLQYIRLRINQEKVNQKLLQACQEGDLQKVQYWLHSPEVKETFGVHANVQAFNEGCICVACERGHLQVVRYLLQDPELKLHADPHAREDEPFLLALHGGHWHVVHYLIFDYQIEQTHCVDKIISFNQDLGVEALFQRRQLNECLQKNIPVNSKRAPKGKV